MWPAVEELLALAAETGAGQAAGRAVLGGVERVAGKRVANGVGKMFGREKVANEPKSAGARYR